LLFEGGDHLVNGIKNITELAEKYPNTVLGAYANASLGIHLSKDFKDLVQNKIQNLISTVPTSFCLLLKTM